MFRSLLFTTLLFVTAAHAEDEGAQATSGGPANSVGSEYLHQAVGHTFELTPGVGVQTSKITIKNSPNKQDKTLIPLTVKAEYGFTDMFSLAAQLGVGIGAVDNTCTSPAICDDTVAGGLLDPIISANMRIPVGIAALRFGADLSVSPSKHKIQADGDENLASGGTTFSPYVGAEILIGPSVFGGKISYDLYRGDRSVEDDAPPANTYKITDEKELDVNLFYEFNFPKIVAIGGALEFTDSPTSKTESGGVKTSNDDAATFTTVKVYVPLRFNTHVTLVPALSGGVVNYKASTSTVDEQTLSKFEVIARFTF